VAESERHARRRFASRDCFHTMDDILSVPAEFALKLGDQGRVRSSLTCSKARLVISETTHATAATDRNTVRAKTGQ